MSSAFVVDASVAVAWVHHAQASASAETLLRAVYDGATLHAPAIWPLELGNALLVLVRRKRLSEAQRQSALALLKKLPVKIDHEMAALALTTLSDLAAAHQLSVYDAAYLELAQRLGLPLACNDGPLRSAARSAKIALV